MSRALAIAVLLASAACGHHIGDSCNVSSDCAQDGTRVCDTFSPGGSCTIQGCDFGTCPDNSVCVRFFPALENAGSCLEQEDCATDEVCTVHLVGEEGKCARRSIEQRFCMPSCGGDGDCRDGYECRDRTLQVRHGGEPVPNPVSPSAEPPDSKFCGSRRSCTQNTDCDQGEACDFDSRVCKPL